VYSPARDTRRVVYSRTRDTRRPEMEPPFFKGHLRREELLSPTQATRALLIRQAVPYTSPPKTRLNPLPTRADTRTTTTHY